MIICRFTSIPKIFKAGIQLTQTSFLPLAIILMGMRLDFSMLLSSSWLALLINLFYVSFAFALTLFLCRKAGLSENLAILLGIGTAICGGAAIAAAAPVIKARDEEVSLSITTITLFGVLAIFFFLF